MGSNYFIIPKTFAESFKKKRIELDQIKQQLNQLKLRLKIIEEEIPNIDLNFHLVMLDMKNPSDKIDYIIQWGLNLKFDESKEVTHIGRSTNNIFIWNIDPNTFEERCKGNNLIVHETWDPIDSDDSYSYDDFMNDIVGNSEYDLDYIHANIHFR